MAAPSTVCPSRITVLRTLKLSFPLQNRPQSLAVHWLCRDHQMETKIAMEAIPRSSWQWAPSSLALAPAPLSNSRPMEAPILSTWQLNSKTRTSCSAWRQKSSMLAKNCQLIKQPRSTGTFSSAKSKTPKSCSASSSKLQSWSRTDLPTACRERQTLLNWRSAFSYT